MHDRKETLRMTATDILHALSLAGSAEATATLIEQTTMNTTHKRAAKGGEFGANGEWYEGGKFINTVPENGKRHGSVKRKPIGKREIDRGVWEMQPFEGAISIYQQLAGVEVFNRMAGKFEFNEDLRAEYATPEAIANRKERIAAYNNGKRWI